MSRPAKLGVETLEDRAVPASLRSIVEEITTGGLVRGWVYDPDTPWRSVVVQLALDGGTVRTAAAALPSPGLLTNLQIPGAHRFALQLPSSALDGQAHTVTLRGFDTTNPANRPVLASRTFRVFNTPPIGDLEDITADGFVTGWAFDQNTPGRSIQIRVDVDGMFAVGATADQPSQDINQSFGITGAHRFGVQLPASLLDGQGHTVTVLAVDSTSAAGNFRVIGTSSFPAATTPTPPTTIPPTTPPVVPPTTTPPTTPPTTPSVPPTTPPATPPVTPSTPAVVPVPPLTAQGQAVVNSSLQLIRECVLPDGSIRMKANGQPVLIRPYFMFQMGLALVAGRNSADLVLVENLLRWAANHQSPDGGFNDYSGTLSGGWQATDAKDSTDATNGLFLLLVNRFHLANGSTPDAVRAAARKAFDALVPLTDPDGLIRVKSDYPFKLYLDQIETLAGERAAAAYFARVGDTMRAQLAGRMAQNLAGALGGYLRPGAPFSGGRLFSYSLNPDGSYSLEDPVKRLGTRGLANLFGVAFVSAADRNPWVHVQGSFRPDTGDAPEAGVEWWYMAATRVGTAAELQTWTTELLNTAGGFTRDNVYAHRPALAVLGLLEGVNWQTA